MVINAKIMKKSAKSQEKERRHDVYLLLMLRYNVHGLCTFPNMVIDANMPRTSEKNGAALYRPSSTMLVYCLHHLCAFPRCIDYMVCAHFPIW